MGDGGWRLRRGQRARHVRKQEASRNLRDPSWSWSGCMQAEYAYRNGSFLREAKAAMEVGLAHMYSERGRAAYMGKRRSNGAFKIVRLTIKMRMRATLAAIRETLMRRRHEPVPVVGRWLRRVLQGYLNYYAVPDNLRRLTGPREVSRAWRHALLRRSQRKRMPWSRFTGLLRKYLPPCKLVHPPPTERFRVNTFGRSRMQ